MAQIERKNCTGEFLDDGQYSRNGILRYERIFGDTFVSTGGLQTTKVNKIKELGSQRSSVNNTLACGLVGAAAFQAVEWIRLLTYEH